MANYVHVMSGPLAVYWAPEDTAAPEIDATIASPWTLLGKTGTTSQSEDGVQIALDGDDEPVYAAGSLYPVKYVPTRREALIKVSLHDMTLDAVRLAFQSAAVQSQSAGTGVPGKDWIEFASGLVLPRMALLARGVGLSPDVEGLNIQFHFPAVVQVGKPEFQFGKDTVSFTLEFRATVTEAGSVGTYQVQTAAAA